VALAKLNQPNIGSVYEFVGQDGLDFVVMEFVSGAAHDDTLASGSLPDEEVIRLGTELASGLEAAHGQRIVDRDLTPRNLRLKPDGRLKVLDFGLAQWIQPESDVTPTVTQMGSADVSVTIP
jgi:eukaryotic-like serine/threonine-protein kinase